jgi:hypothetical protein
MRKRIYISGPITKGHSTYGRNWNLFQANAAMTELLHDGWAVLNGHIRCRRQRQRDCPRLPRPRRPHRCTNGSPA